MKFGRSLIYLRDKQNKPVTAVLVKTTENSPEVQFQFSTCNPKDWKKYNSSLTRTIVEGRLTKKPFTLTMGKVPERFHDVALAVIASVGTLPKAGPITQDVCLRWLNNHTQAATPQPSLGNGSVPPTPAALLPVDQWQLPEAHA